MTSYSFHILLVSFLCEVFFSCDNPFIIRYIHIFQSGRAQARFGIRPLTIFQRLCEWFGEIDYGIAFWTWKDHFAFARSLVGRYAPAPCGTPIR